MNAGLVEIDRESCLSGHRVFDSLTCLSNGAPTSTNGFAIGTYQGDWNVNNDGGYFNDPVIVANQWYYVAVVQNAGSQTEKPANFLNTNG